MNNEEKAQIRELVNKNGWTALLKWLNKLHLTISMQVGDTKDVNHAGVLGAKAAGIAEVIRWLQRTEDQGE